MLRVGHAISFHAGLRAGQGAGLQFAHVLAVHGLHLSHAMCIEAQVLLAAQLVLHHLVAAFAAAVHVCVAVQVLVHARAQASAHPDPADHVVLPGASSLPGCVYLSFFMSIFGFSHSH